MEKLDIGNIIEINRIRKILSTKKDLLRVFEEVIELANYSLLKEEIQHTLIPIEDNIEPNLSDHTSDED